MSSPLKGYTVRGYSDLCYIFSLYKISQASKAKMLPLKGFQAFRSNTVAQTLGQIP